MNMPNETVCKDHLDAFRSAKVVKNAMFWLLIVAVLAQLSGVVMVYFFNMIDNPPEMRNYLPGQSTSPSASKASPSNQNYEVKAGEYYLMIKWGLQVSRVIAFFCSILFCLVLLLFINLSMISRYGHVAGFISAFFWSLVVVMFLLPWYKLFPTDLALGAFFNIEDLAVEARKVKDLLPSDPEIINKKIHFFARFIAYPSLIFVLLLVCQIRFMNGYKPIRELTNANPPEATTQSGVSL